MKKILMALAVLAVAASVATAGVGIQWGTLYGAYDHTVTPPLTGGSGALLDSYSCLWQLIYAGADNVANPLDSMNLTTGGPGIQDDYVTGDDVVWAQRTIPQGGGAAGDGTTWDNWLALQSGSIVYENLSWSTAGFVYQRVFEGTPTLGSWYYQTPLQALNTAYVGGGQPPDTFYVDTDSAGFQPNRQIPEPATMGLLGLGALAMAIRRRRS